MRNKGITLFNVIWRRTLLNRNVSGLYFILLPFLFLNIYLLWDLRSIVTILADTKRLQIGVHHADRVKPILEKEEETKLRDSVGNNKFEEMFAYGVKTHWWYDICLDKTTDNAKWHPLFPGEPEEVTEEWSLSDKGIIHRPFVRRVYGFFRADVTTTFDLQINSRDGVEIIVLDTNMTADTFSIDIDIRVLPKIFYYHMSAEEVVKQDNVIHQFDLFTSNHRVKFKQGRLYYFELIQGGKGYGGLTMRWRAEGKHHYKDIAGKNLFSLNEKYSHAVKFPSLLYSLKRPKRIYNVETKEKIRLDFHKVPRLDVSNSIGKKPRLLCDPVTRKTIDVKLYEGMYFLDTIPMFPREHFNFTENAPLNNLVMNTEKAETVANQVFKSLKRNYDETIQLKNIVHVETNKIEHREQSLKKTWYFVELDVTLNNNDENIYRTSLFVRQNKRGDDVCFLKEYNTWSHSVKINILTPVKNQWRWVKHLLRTLEEVIRRTNERNIVLFIIDYSSSDADLQNLLSSHSVPYKYIRIKEETLFNKVKALNAGHSHVTDANNIVFVLDLHLEIPLDIFDRIRKHTIQGYTAYCPTLLKLACGEHEQYTKLSESTWVDYGYGMMALYKSDWTKIGGMNETLFGTKWGGEDWELTDRIVSNGLYLFHQRLPRFYHIHHSNDHIWDGKKFG